MALITYTGGATNSFKRNLILYYMKRRKYSVKINPSLVYLGEAMLVEGYWSIKSFTASIQNKNLPFLKRIEKILEGLSMPVSKRILLKIKLEEKIQEKEEVKLSDGKRLLSFHLEKSPFDGSLKIVTNLPYKETYNITLTTKKNSYKIITIIGKEEIVTKGDQKAWAYLDLRFPNKVILSFLDVYDMERDNLLEDLSKEHLVAAFSALIDSEGSVDYYSHYRKIRVRMRDKPYLEEWKRILSKYNLYVGLRQNTNKEFQICIKGWDSFNKLQDLGLKLYHSKKSRKFEKIMCSYKRKQVSRNHACRFYTIKLKELNKPITAKKLSIILGKSKRVVNHYLKMLDDKNVVSVNKLKKPYLYSIKSM